MYKSFIILMRICATKMAILALQYSLFSFHAYCLLLIAYGPNVYNLCWFIFDHRYQPIHLYCLLVHNRFTSYFHFNWMPFNCTVETYVRISYCYSNWSAWLCSIYKWIEKTLINLQLIFMLKPFFSLFSRLRLSVWSKED